MVNCSYCDAELKRLAFCNPSHKVMYHRKPKSDWTKEAVRKMRREIEERDQSIPPSLKTPILSKWCEHWAAPMMCKKPKCKNYAY